MPYCGFMGGSVDWEEDRRRGPGVNRGKGRGITKPPVRRKRRK